MASALLIIDVQAGLCAGDEAAWDIEAVIARINGVSARARTAGLPVLFVRHEEPTGLLQRETPAWQVDGRLLQAPGDLHVDKRGSSAFHETDLHALLQARGVEHLITCGLQSEFCVDSTVRSALALGYRVTLVSDAHSTVDSTVLSAAQIVAHHNTTLANVGSYGPRATPVPADRVLVP